MTRGDPIPNALLLAALVVSGCVPLAASGPEPTPGSPSVGAGTSPPPFPTPFLPSDRTPTPGAKPRPTTEPESLSPYLLENGDAAPTPVEPIPFQAEALNILLLGSDRRNGDSFRDDVLILVSVDPEDRSAVMLSIPRDLWVYLPEQGMQRINSAYGIGEQQSYPGGGMGLLRAALLYNLGIPVHRFVRVEMQGFERLVDALGGIEVLVACSYTDWRLEEPDAPPEDRDSWELYTVTPGQVSMDGDLALWYSRARARSSDFDRSRRQQEVLRALHRLAQQPNMLARIPSMYRALAKHVTTDLTLSDLLSLAPLAAELGPASVRSRFIGREQVENYRVPTSGAAVLIAKPDALRILLQEAFSKPSAIEAGPLSELEVELIDASRRPAWALLAAERLAYAGVSVQAGPPLAIPAEQTILVDTLSVDDPARRALLETLGLGPTSLLEVPEPAGRPRFRLIVADDYNPCFDPTRRGRVAGG